MMIPRGGFKPPTDGHFKIVKNALQEFPEIDEFIILDELYKNTAGS